MYITLTHCVIGGQPEEDIGLFVNEQAAQNFARVGEKVEKLKTPVSNHPGPFRSIDGDYTENPAEVAGVW